MEPPVASQGPPSIAPAEPTVTDAVAKPVALKDRIADLQLRRRAAETGDRLTQRVRALQAAAPGAAAEASATVKARFGSLTQRVMKINRADLTAKIEALIKPRAVEPEAPPRRASASDSTATAGLEKTGSAKTGSPKTGSPKTGVNIAALKSQLDAALRPAAERPTTITEVTSAVGTALPIAVVDAAPLRTGWSLPFARARRPVPTLTEVAAEVAAAAPIAAPMPDLAPRTQTARATSRTTTELTTGTRTRRPTLTLLSLLTAVVTGGVLHIVTTFAVTNIGTGSAFDRLRWKLDANVMTVLPVDPTGATALPFLSPDMRYAICRFDITSGPVSVSAVLPELGWSLALYTPQGDNFYATPGQDGRAVEAVFTLLPPTDRLLLPTPGQRQSDVDAARVTSPTREGLVVLRAPLKGLASLPLIEATFKRATCQAALRR